MSLKDRFWAKVAIVEGGCWIWTACTKNGYGCINPGGKRGGTVYSHRLSYSWSKGDIPKGLQAMHSCDNRLCVNPAHLSLGTNKDNSDDMMRKGRHKGRYQK